MSAEKFVFEKLNECEFQIGSKSHVENREFKSRWNVMICWKVGNFLYPLNTYLLNQTINFLLELSRSDKNIHDHLFIRILRLIHVELVNIKSWKIFVVGIIGIYESYEFHIIGFFFSLGWVHKYDLHVRFYLLGSPANTNITSFFAKFLSISMYQIPVYSLFLFL